MTDSKTAKKTTQKKSAAKATVKKATPKKAAPKKAAPNKAAPKKAAPKKAAPKKAAPKKAKKVVVKKKKVVKQKGGHIEEEEVAGKRYFKCIMINENDEVLCSGRYSGKKPKQAASKACSRIYEHFKDIGQAIPESIIFGMHECTRTNKKKKKYFYTGKRIVLDHPEEVPIHQKDADKNYILDTDGNKMPKLNPKTNKPMISEA